MSAPLKNQFWRNRSVHGRDKLFATPELLWKACEEYFNWCDSHPWYKVEASKAPKIAKADQLIKVPNAIPYTLSGLCIYLNASRSWWTEFRKNEKLSHGFLEIITRVEEIIYTQKFSGAAVGAFNANIMARDLGMVDRSELSGPGGESLNGTLLNITLPPGMNINFPSNTNDESSEE